MLINVSDSVLRGASLKPEDLEMKNSLIVKIIIRPNMVGLWKLGKNLTEIKYCQYSL